MTSPSRHLVVPWLLLLGLTTIAYIAGATPRAPGTLSDIIPLGTASAKFCLVAWFFMGLRAASRLWALGLGALLATIMIIIIYLLAAGS